jgi:hypothetical protein
MASMCVKSPVVRVAVLAAAFALQPTLLRAQDDLAAACAAASTQSGTAAYCATVAQIADLVPGRIAIAAAGGNPVPGTGSTLGIRLGSFPRFSVNGRFTGVRTGLPAAQGVDSDTDEGITLTGWHGDVSIGLFSGFSPFATVGGVGAIDLLGSLGTVDLPGEDGLSGRNVTTWGAGARIGITRESFTAPGISLSVMYRDLGEFTYGDNGLDEADAFVHVDETWQWSFRGVVGKRITALGVTGGLGYDRYGGEALLRVRDGGGFVEVIDEHSGGRWNAFVNGSFTVLVISANAELGWQSGAAAPPAALADESGDGAFFASFAIRLGL